MKIEIKEVGIENREEILEVHMDAFENYGAEQIKVLVNDLLDDESAYPLVSLMAYVDGKPAGHVFFSKAINENKENKLSSYILAPLAVIKSVQKVGIGKKLIEAGVEKLKELNADLAFVLGHIEYYPKCGFIKDAITNIGYKATYDIPKEHYNAWMYMPLTSMEKIKENPGRVICADTMNKPDYWIE